MLSMRHLVRLSKLGCLPRDLKNVTHRPLLASRSDARKRFVQSHTASKTPISDALDVKKEAYDLMSNLYNEVKAQRFDDIVVIETKFNTDPRYFILANAFNKRHLLNGTEQINKQYKHLKSSGQDFADLSISDEWNVLDCHAVIVHLFSQKCRKHFDLDQLWAVGPEYDDHLVRGTDHLARKV